MRTLEELTYIDGYKLYEALKDGCLVSFSVRGCRYEACFKGQPIGCENWLEVDDGSFVNRWGWGWCSETCFHLLHDLLNGRFRDPFFKFRRIRVPPDDCFTFYSGG